VAESKDTRTITIFYAWEDSLPVAFNRYAIRKALHSASADLEKDLSVNFGNPVGIVIDDATRGLSGSPNIPAAILKKIPAADVFVADVSAIGLDQTDESKTIPNPNVVFELGYAVAHLGWERVILLVNEVYGPVEKLPFDFDRNRASPFRFARDGVGSQKGLTDLVKAAVGLIIEKDPPRPKAGRFDAAEARRERDLTNLRWILESIHWPTVDDHIETGAKFLSDASVSMNDAVNAIRPSSTFHVNDEELKSAFRRFVETWNNTMRHDHYIPRKRGRGFVFKHGEHPREYAEGLKDFE
jgi:hypothetical protein